jgi:acid stress chaperone HdeB
VTKLKAVLAIATGALIISGSGAIAQAKINMAKITCADLVNSYPDEMVVIGTWMSGYYNAKRNNTTIDPKTLAANSKRVADYCRANPKVTVMKAIESL